MLRTIPTLLFALSLLACGEEERAYIPGTLPAGLKFEIVRLSDGPQKGVVVSRTTERTFRSATPDFEEEGVSVWRYRSLFGDLIDEPGAGIVFVRGSTKTTFYDPGRLYDGQEACLVVQPDGRAESAWIVFDKPHEAHAGTASGTIQLEIDDTAEASHNRLGVLRVRVVRDETWTHTLSEDDFDGASWRLFDKQGKRRRAWSIRGFEKQSGLRLVALDGKRSTSEPIKRADWRSKSRQPVLRLKNGKLDFGFEDVKTGEGFKVSIHDIKTLHTQ